MRTKPSHPQPPTTASDPSAPLTYDDLRHVDYSHGFRPIGGKPAKAARVLHTVYATWEKEQGLRPGRGYLMPLHQLIGRVREAQQETGRALDRVTVRAVVLDALNHPRSSVEILRRPYRESAA